ncbi:tRNA lysidine(34) synthetase TilS [Massilia sp. NP310]|uniref:tRNA lysidine(34) synthetase TilS n=1 Tax=unclassified Massilia TaxID=2609279 RepID=UPI001C62BF87|nr:tRNA lysidine(34) synthetase TilS [Massilia sp. NP310]QYG02309.1 tRNA lysidine(34) synthetase TilS [Massilia sp. NP310]
MSGLRAKYSPQSIAVACSGGLDSMVLLRLAHDWCAQHGVRLHAFHVHHGLSPHADDWRAHCERSAAALGIGFDQRRVTIGHDGSGVEAAARKLRYAALGEMCRAHGANLLLTAHHLDDQAETVLLQLLRGSGPAGLSGMDADNLAPGLLGVAGLPMARPLLSQPRAALEAYAAEHGLQWVEDESNQDPRYTRNALRHQVMPALAANFPGFQARLARGAAHVASAQRLLDELAAQDLAACQDGDAIDLACLGSLSADRIDNFMRHLFMVRGLAMPSTAWLNEMVAQLFSAREDAQLKVTHPGCHIRRHRGKLYLTPHLPDLAGMRDPDDIGVLDREGQAFRWQGEASIAFPDYGGVLHFETAQQGFDAAWLRAQTLTIDFRKGGERLKPAANRPSRSLKAHYQALGVPAWERERLPTVSRDLDLLFAAGIGMDCRHWSAVGQELIALRWEVN